MSAKLYKLSFPSGLHLDAGSYGYETSEVMLHSDTLFGALCCTSNLLGGQAWVNKLLDGLLVSSAFPYLGGRLFFPKPLHLALPDFAAEHYDREKAWKKVRFVEERLLRQLFLGEIKVENTFLPEQVKNGCWFGGQPEQVCETVEHPRVAIDRVTQASTIFHFQEVHFAEGGGLFFLADFKGDTELKNIFHASLRLLGDEGVGSDGTVGKGWFEPSMAQDFLPLSKLDNNRYYMLSLYHPAEGEAEHIVTKDSNYDIVTRRGWASFWGGMDLRRRSVKMFMEGSVLAFNPIEPKGSVVQVLTFAENDIWRYGKAFI